MQCNAVQYKLVLQKSSRERWTSRIVPKEILIRPLLLQLLQLRTWNTPDGSDSSGGSDGLPDVASTEVEEDVMCDV